MGMTTDDGLDGRTLEGLLAREDAAEEAVRALMRKAERVPPWEGPGGLAAEYDPRRHAVMDAAVYPDRAGADGGVERVTRIPLGLQRLAAKRLTELCVGTPVKRIYRAEGAGEREAARRMEAIFGAARIDSVNVARCLALFASCEVATLWYGVPARHRRYGFDSPLRLRCRTFSPMQGDALYPRHDAAGDMVALSVARRGEGGTLRLDAYTAGAHAVYRLREGGWRREGWEPIALGKIPAAYMWRPQPAWEDTTRLVEEMEWTLSRNGNYLRKNSKPLFTVFADEEIAYGGERGGEGEGRAVLQFPKGSAAGYVTWPQAVDSLKFHIAELRQLFFTQLQLPDWSYESMKSAPMSGESRRQLFIDAHLKVLDERGRLQEFFEREVNVVRAFLRGMMPGEAEAVDSLGVTCEVTPFALGDEREQISNLLLANGNRPLVSQREAIEYLGWSADAARTLEEIRADGREDLFTMAD